MHLAGWVHGARLGQDIVLLDTRKGEYFCLPNGADAFSPSGSDLEILDADLAADLSDLALLGEPDPLRRAPPPRASLDLGSPPSPRLATRELLDAVVAYGVMLRRYYRRPFAELITYAAKHRPTAPPREISADLVRRVALFRRLLPLAPFPGVCLYRAFLLLIFLRQAGFDADWVFGVKTWSFEAHCWLQIGDTVLDDRAERLVAYTPILVV